MKNTLLVMSIVALCVLTSLSFVPEQTRAQPASPASELSGFAWSSNIGWISFNCSDTSACTSSNYKVTFNQDGTLTGFAWSSNIGWVQFGGLSGFPGSNGNAHIESVGNGYELVGWARALSHGGGWDGWISFNCHNTGCTDTNNYRVQLQNGGATANSYAWGSDVVGWIDMALVRVENTCEPSLACSADGSSIERTDFLCRETITQCVPPESCVEGPVRCETVIPTGSLTANPPLVQAGASSNLRWNVANADSCRIEQVGVNVVTDAPLSGEVASAPISVTQEVYLYCTRESSEYLVDSVRIEVVGITEEI